MIEAQRAAARRVEAVLTGHSLARLQDDPPVPVAARAAAMDLTQGTLRHLGQLRAVVAQLATRGVPEAPIEALLVVALYQLLHTRAAPYAIVDHAVTATREHSPNRAAAGFVNALLRRFLRERDPLLQRAAREPEGRWSHPAWWVRQLEAQYGAAAAPILEAGLDHPPMALRANLRRIDPIVCAERLAAAGFAHRVLDNGALLLDQPVAAAKLPGYAEGELSIQD
ncbi:MAG: 16S rRNA (cytosine(967)-C(5))-methyltransferase RsmB, partial [Burkholderiales bacterium]|nr:16S rRNA (cytosine(967)-C(5))-methyltransferase RsmB [Burkholderiales bacterium]